MFKCILDGFWVTVFTVVVATVVVFVVIVVDLFVFVVSQHHTNHFAMFHNKENITKKHNNFSFGRSHNKTKDLKEREEESV